MSRVLITGIGGFVGPYVLAELAGHGFRVGGVDRVAAPELSGRARLFEADLREETAVRNVVETFAPEAIVHLAAISDVALSFRNPELVRHGRRAYDHQHRVHELLRAPQDTVGRHRR